MIIRIVKMTFREDGVQEFLNIFEQSKSKIRASEGCMSLELWREKGKENVFFTHSRWDNEEHLNMYRKSELFASVWPKTKALFEEKAETWSLNLKEDL